MIVNLVPYGLLQIQQQHLGIDVVLLRKPVVQRTILTVCPGITGFGCQCGDDPVTQVMPRNLLGDPEEDLVDHVDFGVGGADSSDQIAAPLPDTVEPAEHFGAQAVFERDGELHHRAAIAYETGEILLLDEAEPDCGLDRRTHSGTSVKRIP